MVRFGLSSPQSPVGLTFVEDTKGKSPPIQLACLSEDGRSIHCIRAVEGGRYVIETSALPLQGTTDEKWESNSPSTIRTELPDTVASMLSVDPVIDFLCVEGDAGPSRTDGVLPPGHHPLSLLCLYTRHSAFLLQLSYPESFSEHGVTAGTCVSVQQPFQTVLDSLSSGLSIVRIRAAPHQRLGYATFSPPGSMAMLTHDATSNTYAFSLFHGVSEAMGSFQVTTPLEFGIESWGDERDNAITDFNFCQSNELSLLASISVHFLKGSGEVWGASPVVFDGSIVASVTFQQSWDFVDSVGETDFLDNPAKKRQYRAARMFLKDAFRTTGDSDIMTSFVFNGRNQSSTSWPIQLQGPLIMPCEEEYRNEAVVIEPFFSQDLVGVAIGRRNSAVDFAIMPPSALLPRFKYESSEDYKDLNEDLMGLGVVVERVDLDLGNGDEGGSPQSNKAANLIRDPIKENLIHFVSNHHVLSILTHEMGNFSKRIRRATDGPTVTRETKAWVSLEVLNSGIGTKINGAAISSDARLGHVLLAVLSDGHMEPINLTESLMRLEVSQGYTDASSGKKPVDKAMQSMLDTQPMTDLLLPLFEKVQNGLLGMTKLVGSSTSMEDVDARLIATALDVRKRCENDLAVPLRQIRRTNDSRIAEIKKIQQGQLKQLSIVKASLKELKGKLSSTKEQTKAIVNKTIVLAQRYDAVLQSARALRPALTAADEDFFRLIGRVRVQCDEWEKEVETLQRKGDAVIQQVDENSDMPVRVALSPEESENCQTLLQSQAATLRGCQARIESTQSNVDELIALTGIGTPVNLSSA